jgi:hypothetical protein
MGAIAYGGAGIAFGLVLLMSYLLQVTIDATTQHATGMANAMLQSRLHAAKQVDPAHTGAIDLYTMVPAIHHPYLSAISGYAAGGTIYIYTNEPNPFLLETVSELADRPLSVGRVGSVSPGPGTVLLPPAAACAAVIAHGHCYVPAPAALPQGSIAVASGNT